MNYIDLFAGCGGLSLGLFNAGWHGLFAVEKSPDAFSTLKHNLIQTKKHFTWPEWLPQQSHDINDITATYKEQLAKLKGTVDLVAGGPPCQGFSMAGRRNEDDTRNRLIDSYIEFIRIVNPKLLFFENVKGFTQGFQKNKKEGEAYSKYVWAQLEGLGYNVQGKIVDFAEYGVPQRRKRFILVGIQEELCSESKSAKDFFTKLEAQKQDFLAGKELPYQATVADAISDLLQANGCVDSPDTPNFYAGVYVETSNTYQKYMRDEHCKLGNAINSHRFANHKEDTITVFETILQRAVRNKSIDDTLREELKINKHVVTPLSPDQCSPTLTTLPDDYIHYCEPRILTVRECARIQSFPDWYEFKGKYTTGGERRKREVPRYSQIGNAIPPLFAEQCGLIFKKLLSNGSSG